MKEGEGTLQELSQSVSARKSRAAEGAGCRGDSRTPSLLAGDPRWPRFPFIPLRVQEQHQRSDIFSSVSSWQAKSKNVFVEFLSPNDLGRSASKRKRIVYFLPFRLLSKI